jgi:hypothetical protein
MNQNDPLIRQLEAYLVEYEGPTPLPDTVRDAVRAQLPTTKQTGSISGPVRDIYMNSSMDTPARWGLVAAVVIGAVIIGGALFFGGGGVGSPPDATPSPSVEPSDAAPSAESSAPAGLPEGPHVLQDGDGDNAFDNVPMTVTIPAPGWNGDPAGGLLVKNEGDPDGALIGAWAGIEQM